MNRKLQALNVAEILSAEYPEPKTELVYSNERELSIAVMLSAQTTDKKVNEITSKLFKKYASWKEYAKADLETLQSDLRGVNFHKGKADRLIKAGKLILDEFGGELPKTVKELIRIPGVARKTANVITQELWGITEGIVVDTHVTRLSNLLGLTEEKDAVKIERELMDLFPKKYWRIISGALVLHGRYVCKARNPDCENCVLNAVCPSSKTTRYL